MVFLVKFSRMASSCGFVVPLAFLAVGVLLIPSHSLFEEWDGVIQAWAGQELLAAHGYRGWASRFWPPLYPLLLGVGGWFGGAFAAAKWISWFSGALTLWVTYRFVKRETGSSLAALIAQMVLATHGAFILSSLQAENHALDAALIACAFVLAGEPTSRRQALGVGVLLGLAGLTRYTSFAFVPAIALLCAAKTDEWSERFWVIARVASGLVLVSAPWWAYNTAHFGSPLATWQHLNVGSRLSGEPARWLWFEQSAYADMGAVWRGYSSRYVGHVWGNIKHALELVGASLGVFLPLAIWGVRRARALELLAVVGWVVVHLLLVSQAFVFGEVFLPWLAPAIMLSFLSWPLVVRLHDQHAPLVWGTFAALVLVPQVASKSQSIASVVEYLEDHDDNGQLVASTQVADVLAAQPDIHDALVVSSHPERAWRVGANWAMAPLFYQGDVEGWVNYDALPAPVLRYVPRRPARLPEHALEADYLIFGPVLAKRLPQFDFLMDPTDPRVPGSFRVIGVFDGVVVYKISGGEPNLRTDTPR